MTPDDTPPTERRKPIVRFPVMLSFSAPESWPRRLHRMAEDKGLARAEMLRNIVGRSLAAYERRRADERRGPDGKETGPDGKETGPESGR